VIGFASSLTISIIPNSNPSIDLENKKSHFYVLLTNTSSDSINIWDPAMEWGCSNLWFEVKVEQDKIDTVRPRFCNLFDANYPHGFAISPTQSYVYEVNLWPAAFGWSNSPLIKSKPGSNISIKANYQSGSYNDSDSAWEYLNNSMFGKIDWRKYIWRGSISSEWYKFPIWFPEGLKDECNDKRTDRFNCEVNYPDGYYPDSVLKERVKVREEYIKRQKEFESLPKSKRDSISKANLNNLLEKLKMNKK